MLYAATVEGKERIIYVHSRNSELTTFEPYEPGTYFGDRLALTTSDLYSSEMIATFPSDQVILRHRVYAVSMACFLNGPWPASVHCGSKNDRAPAPLDDGHPFIIAIQDLRRGISRGTGKLSLRLPRSTFDLLFPDIPLASKIRSFQQGRLLYRPPPHTCPTGGDLSLVRSFTRLGRLPTFRLIKRYAEGLTPAIPLAQGQRSSLVRKLTALRRTSTNPKLDFVSFTNICRYTTTTLTATLSPDQILQLQERVGFPEEISFIRLSFQEHTSTLTLTYTLAP